MKLAWPDALVVPETVVIVEEPPDLASVTVLPGTTFDWASLSVTVTVDVVLPSASTEPGAALTVDWAAVGVPGVKVTVAVCRRPVRPIVAV